LIFLILGPPGSGKSTLAQAIVKRFERGMHIPIDELREWVVSGAAHPVPDWSDETGRQFELAERAAADIAARYFDAGFAVAIDHINNPAHLEERIVQTLAPRAVTRVMLVPSLEANLARNEARTNKDFDPSLLVRSIEGLNRTCSEFEDPYWMKIDNSELGVEETIDRILSSSALY